MFYTFLHTFGETLGFDMESLPSLDSLQMAMLYDSEEKLLSAMTHLLAPSKTPEFDSEILHYLQVNGRCRPQTRSQTAR